MYKIIIYLILLLSLHAIFLAKANVVAVTLPPDGCPTIPTTNGKISVSATLPQSGNYYIYTRIKAPDASNNSIYVTVTSYCAKLVETSVVNSWQWVPMSVFSPYTNITVDIAGKQSGIAIDKIMIIPQQNGQPACVPVDQGDNCTNVATVTSAAGFCPKKNIGDADCKIDPKQIAVNILDYAIWYSEFINGCSISNLAKCGNDQDGDGSAMDANFNYPGTSYIVTDEKVDVFDYSVWIQGYLVESSGVTPTSIPATPTPTGVQITPTTPVSTATPTPTPTPSISNAQYPAQVLNLTNWKITIPFDGSDSDSNADEIKQPALATYKDPNYFFVSPAGNSVIFRAHAGGATTSGSGYPRSELRERTNNGTADAAWSASSGKHTMIIDQRVNKLPVVKPHLVVGQIHGGSDDLTVFRLEGTKLFIDLNGADGPVLTNNYQLGTRFTVGFEVENNKVKYYYNGNLVPFTLNTTASGAYFKAGAYTQSSCQGDKKVPGESCDAYGEVEIFNVQVTHQ